MKWVYVDLARGLAAFAVMASHLRTFVFTDYATAPAGNPAWTAFYFVTGFGHEAVMVFFVLSGFLVGGSVQHNIATGRWSWTDYAARRMSRLWTVLLPALLLTALLDWLGRSVFGFGLYQGAASTILNSTPLPGDMATIYGAGTFLANLFFLQGVAAKTFGTNGPLWSLANEFWYYVMFPLAALAWHGRKRIQGLAYGVALIALAAALPRGVVVYMAIWLFGFLVAAVTERATAIPKAAILRVIAVLGGVSLAVALVAARLAQGKYGLSTDFAIGASFAVFLFALLHARPPHAIVAAFAKASANVSYTLYLTHFPLLALLWCILLGERQLPPSLAALGVYAGLFLAALAWAAGVYWLFERNTDKVRRALVWRSYAPAG